MGSGSENPRCESRGRGTRRNTVIGFFFVLALVTFVGIFVLSFFSDFFSERRGSAEANRAANDPRHTYQGPFQNIHPDVAYVGMKACATADCHAGIAETYYQHPMARSLIPIAHLAKSQPYDQRHRNPFQVRNSLFQVDRQGDRVWHRELWLAQNGQPAYRNELEVHYAIGSGNHGHSYLAVQGDGYITETPISWFSQKQIWDISPGFTPSMRRAISGTCLFCHANRAFPREEYFNRYQTPIFSGHAIGCERCHGPGGMHVKNPGLKTLGPEDMVAFRARVRRADLTIVNPGKLKPQLREAVCQQCHLEGEVRVIRRGLHLYDFRPGMPLDLFWSVFLYARESGVDRKAVNHVEQMYLSRCFERSPHDNKLGCISCHDPHQHVASAQRLEHYRKRCVQCHAAGDKGERGRLPCILPLTERNRRNSDNCVACHMPPYSSSDIVHAASTDHRILRRPQKEPPMAAERDWRMPLVHFQQGALDSPDRELARDLSIALARFARKHKDIASVAKAVDLLENSVQDFPDDWDVWEEKGKSLLTQRRFSEALAAFEAVLAKNPQKETTLAQAALAAQMLGELALSLDFWRRAAAMNPYLEEYQANLARILAQQESWVEVGVHCRKWLSLNPANSEARQLFIDYLIRTGKRDDARVEFSRLISVRPANREQLRTWFQERIR